MEAETSDPILVDGHEDLAYNMLTFGRDYTRPVSQTRHLEAGGPTPERNGDTLLGWPEYMQGRVALIFATLFAAPTRRKLGDWDLLVFNDPGQAHHLYRQELDVYHALVEEHSTKFRLVLTRRELDDHLSDWEQAGDRQPLDLPVGLVPLMECAEGVRSRAELADWWDWGVRLIGPAWAGTRFCGGTREPGPLTPEGFELLEGMAEHGFVLDLSHMDEAAALQALDVYPGQIIASHSNALALLKGTDSNRHLTDRMLQGLLERDGVIGVVPANGFLRPDWIELGGKPAVQLEHVLAQIDYICQMAGDARHIALGTDFDGGFGLQSVPAEIDTIADLKKLVPRLKERGYSKDDIVAIFGGNWIRMLRGSLP
jgi:membrane dipeptidase